MNLEGDIREINLVERLVELWREKFTGAIRFENDGVIKIIYFKTGDVLSASTNDRADSVDEILMRAGKVSREHVKQALAKRKENETLGDALLNLGFITRKELTWARRVQVINVIRSIDQWGAGSFTIVADYLPKREEGTIFPLPQLLVELIVTDQDRQKYERELASGSAVFAKGPSFADSFSSLGLNEDAEKIVAQIDGQRTASDVAAASGQEAFNTFKLLHALTVLGLLQRAGVAAPPGHAADEFEMAGAADAADAWSVPMPQFDLDDAPPVVVAPVAAPPAPSFDASPVPQLHIDESLIADTPASIPDASPMPAWDTPPRGASPASAPAPEPPAEAAEEPQWGFDEAQIETARHATIEPVPTRPLPPIPPRRATLSQPKKQKKRSFGLIVALMSIFILAGLAYGGFLWWNGRSAPAETLLVQRPKRPAIPTATATAAPVSTDTVTTDTVAPPAATTATAAATTTVAPPAEVAARPTAAAPVTPLKPVQQTAAPTPPAPELVRPVTRSSPARERFDSMAREFASTPQGKFTVQFEIVCEPSNVEKALTAGGTNVWFVPISIKGRGCYRVFWGHYASRDAAERGMTQIPAALREGKPAVIEVPKP